MTQSFPFYDEDRQNRVVVYYDARITRDLIATWVISRAMPEATFVNRQYGPDEEDRRSADSLYGWFMNGLEDVLRLDESNQIKKLTIFIIGLSLEPGDIAILANVAESVTYLAWDQDVGEGNWFESLKTSWLDQASREDTRAMNNLWDHQFLRYFFHDPVDMASWLWVRRQAIDPAKADALPHLALMDTRFQESEIDRDFTRPMLLRYFNRELQGWENVLDFVSGMDLGELQLTAERLQRDPQFNQNVIAAGVAYDLAQRRQSRE